MLNTIKTMINQKKDFLEAAEIIFEDGMGNSLDDAIILGEDSSDEFDNNFISFNEDDEIDKDENTIVDKSNDEDNSNEDNEGDLMDAPVDDSTDNPETNSSDNEGDLMDAPVDDNISSSIPKDNDIPTPVSSVTREPVADNINDLMSVEIDLGSNTVKDILPVPPNNAGEAIADDILDQRIDSGFGDDNKTEMSSSSIDQNDNSDNIMNNNIDDLNKDELNEDGFNEAIEIGDSDSTEKSDDTSVPPIDVPPTDGSTVSTSEGDNSGDTDTNEEENEVTAAVKDKVAEADSPSFDGDTNEAKEDIMKKLSNITKTLEDAKRAVMSAI